MSLWIRSEQSLERHPKTLRLKELTKLETDQVVGRLHQLWWWCLDYAHDGDLRKKSPDSIELACKISLKDLCSAGFIDSRPYRRIHDWWQYSGNYLKIKYRHSPDKWMQIEEMYKPSDKTLSKTVSKTLSKTVDVQTYRRTDVQNVRTDVQEEKKSAPLAPGGAASLPESEMMTPEEMKEIRLKTLGPKPRRIF